MTSEKGKDGGAEQKATRRIIDNLAGLFVQDPTAFHRETELHGQLSRSLSENQLFATGSTAGLPSLVHQQYPTPFKCQMGDLRMEVLDDDSGGMRGHYDLVVVNPWWLDKASCEAATGEDFTLFRREIRDKAQSGDPPLCLVGIEIHLVRDERPRLADYSRVMRDYRKLLLSGTLANGWRFMDHRYMLVYSHHSQPHEAKWTELAQAAWEQDVDPRNAWLAWTSPRGTRWSG